MLIEQAVFSSGLTDQADGYQLLGRSGGVSAADARELAAWGPAHDSLRDPGPAAMSFNFHPLPSGAFSVSRTVAAGPEYSGRGLRVYTQYFVVASRTLILFANNPFNVLKAAAAAGALVVHDQVPEQLDALRLDAVGTAVDRQLLAQLATQPGPTAIALIVEAALGRQRAAVSGPIDAVQCFAGLMSCLPVAYRTEISFSTGLRFSPRRPYRVITVDGNPAERRRLTELHDLTLLDLSTGHAQASRTPCDGWARFVGSALTGGKTALLANELSQPFAALGSAGLNDLGDRLRRKLLSAETASEAGSWPANGEVLPRQAANPDAVTDDVAESRQRADGPHSKFNGSAEHRVEAGSATVSCDATSCDATNPAAASSRHASGQSQAEQEVLEHLDDVVYGAINGRSDSLAELEVLWPAVLKAVSPQLIDESREQYLRSALAVCTDYLGDSRREASRAAAALDVLCVLFEH